MFTINVFLVLDVKITTVGTNNFISLKTTDYKIESKLLSCLSAPQNRWPNPPSRLKRADKAQ